MRLMLIGYIALIAVACSKSSKSNLSEDVLGIWEQTGAEIHSGGAVTKNEINFGGSEVHQLEISKTEITSVYSDEEFKNVSTSSFKYKLEGNKLVTSDLDGFEMPNYIIHNVGPEILTVEYEYKDEIGLTDDKVSFRLNFKKIKSNQLATFRSKQRDKILQNFNLKSVKGFDNDINFSEKAPIGYRPELVKSNRLECQYSSSGSLAIYYNTDFHEDVDYQTREEEGVHVTAHIGVIGSENSDGIVPDGNSTTEAYINYSDKNGQVIVNASCENEVKKKGQMLTVASVCKELKYKKREFNLSVECLLN